MCKDYTYEIGNDGGVYAVFSDSAKAMSYEHKFYNYPVAHFGNYENAYQMFPQGFGM